VNAGRFLFFHFPHFPILMLPLFFVLRLLIGWLISCIELFMMSFFFFPGMVAMIRLGWYFVWGFVQGEIKLMCVIGSF